ncbi:restriction endonuclease subunit S [Bacteroides fragilis]|uniref:restriction endonuclease subunit S n=1 Tax=Bacteroides fragilis TaxID=817 RepID=UPI000EBC08F6|nr:restriction endonuclease subunit S [Bacteroides fragilis]MCS2773048.1 restriction endonuclease subunit S [Bacteroides fragilis]RGJ13792.1 restriction endonuclease subunit S [Bacteroides fragilis]RHM87964.1 restriction endonuclease subunit S [Bacteroides fragilis]
MQTLANIADYVSEKISSKNITLEQYVTTDSLLQDKRGRERAQNLPPVSCNLTHFKKGDVLVANIRPYLKKIWYADTEGGCSSDVLAFRAKESSHSDFLYAILMADSFYSHAMVGAKGSKMPRGDKDQIMRYKLPILSNVKNIGKMIVDINSKISLNRAINHNLEAMMKQLYNYWFVQFDFPNEEGKPYKSNGGEMVWNEELKREIPQGWSSMSIGDYAPCKSGYAFKSKDFGSKGLPVIKIGNIQENYTLNMTDSQCIDLFNNTLFLAKRYDLVIAMTGATIGKFAISQRNYWVNQRVGRFDLGDRPLLRLGFLFNSLKQEYFREQVFQIACGCAQPNISAEQIDSISVLKPNDIILNQFNKLCEPLLELQSENYLEVEKLTKQRNELLPLLMNGQVSVNYDLSHD